MNERNGTKPGLAAGRVVLGPRAFLKGWLVTFGIWAISTLLFAIAGELLGPNSGALTFWGIAMGISLVVAICIAAPLAFVLSLLLQRVLDQWVHVAAFTLVSGGMAAVTTALILQGIAVVPIVILALVVGIAGGVGRAAVIRDVNP